jgi:hypothetical protein
MTAEDNEDLQQKIVELCHAAGKFGVPEERIVRALENTTYLPKGGDDQRAKNSDTLARNLRYLKSKGWIEEVQKDLRPDLRRWQSTAAGDEYLMTQGLI